MTCARAVQDLNIKNAAANKGVIILLQYDEFKIELQNMESSITDLRDSL